MAKVRGEQYPASESSMRTRRRRDPVSPDANDAFVRAFADALRDILQAETRAAF